MVLTHEHERCQRNEHGELETRYSLANKMVWGCTMETVDARIDRQGCQITNTGTKRVKDTPANLQILRERESLMTLYSNEMRRREISPPPLV